MFSKDSFPQYAVTLTRDGFTTKIGLASKATPNQYQEFEVTSMAGNFMDWYGGIPVMLRAPYNGGVLVHGATVFSSVYQVKNAQPSLFSMWVLEQADEYPYMRLRAYNTHLYMNVLRSYPGDVTRDGALFILFFKQGNASIMLTPTA